MIKRLLFISLLGIVLFFTACIDSTTVISVRKDGSGTITEIAYVNQSVMEMAKGMFAQFGDEEKKEGAEALDLLNTEKYVEKASQLGSGVKFVSVKEIKGKDGSPGTEVVYAFDDIRKLNIEAMPDNPMGDEVAGMMGAESAEDEEDKQPFTFDFIKGSTPTLVIQMPRKDKPETKEEPEEEAETDVNAAAGMAMMKQFFEGFRIRMMVTLLEGKISKTNASFVDRTGGKETVTLLDVAMGEILKNEKYIKEFENMSQIKDMNTALEKMKKIPGLKIETAEKVEISFK